MEEEMREEMSPGSNSSSSLSPPQLEPQCSVDDISVNHEEDDSPEDTEDMELDTQPASPITEPEFESMYYHYIQQDLKSIGEGDFSGFGMDDINWYTKFVDKKSLILYDVFKRIKSNYFKVAFEKRRGVIPMRTSEPKMYLIYPKIFEKNDKKEVVRARVKKIAAKKREPVMEEEKVPKLEEDPPVQTAEMRATPTPPPVSKSTPSRRPIQPPKRYLEGEQNLKQVKRVSGKQPSGNKDNNAFQIGLLPPKYPRRVEKSPAAQNNLGSQEDISELAELETNMESEQNISSGFFEISRLLQSGELEEVVFQHKQIQIQNKLDELKLQQQLTCDEEMEELEIEIDEEEDQQFVEDEEEDQQFVEDEDETKQLLECNGRKGKSKGVHLELEMDSMGKRNSPNMNCLRQICTRRCIECGKGVLAFKRGDGRMSSTCLSCCPRPGSSSSLLKMNSAPPSQSLLKRNSARPSQSLLKMNSARPSQSLSKMNSAPPSQSLLKMYSARPSQSLLKMNSAPPSESLLKMNSAPPSESLLKMNSAPPSQSLLKMNSAPPSQSLLKMYSAPPVELELLLRIHSYAAPSKDNRLTSTKTSTSRIPQKAPEVYKNKSSMKTIPALIPAFSSTSSGFLQPSGSSPVDDKKEKNRPQPLLKSFSVLPPPPPLKVAKKSLNKSGNGSFVKNGFPKIKIPQLTGRTFKSPQNQLRNSGWLPHDKNIDSMRGTRRISAEPKIPEFLKNMKGKIPKEPMLWPPLPMLKHFAQP